MLQTALACAALLGLSACERLEQAAQPSSTSATAAQQQLEWARAALERNPQLELLATDAQKGVLTVRNRSTGEVQVLQPADLAAVPVASLRSPEDAAPRSGPPRAASEQTSRGASRRGERPDDRPDDPGPGRVANTAAPERQAAPGDEPAAPEEAAPEGRNYTIERSNGQVRVSGPGVSIVSSGTSAAGASGEPARTTDQPIICEGRRMVHLDNRDLYVEGDAIVARGGCELYITNSRIVATGTGIVVKDATVHVSNSRVAGGDSPFDADDRARLYVRSSTFEGVPKRTELAMVQDQGGNRWR